MSCATGAPRHCRRSPRSAASCSRRLIFLAITAGTPRLRGGRSPPLPTSRSPLGCSRCSATASPPGVKLFLLTVAIVDDIIAIAIIAIFYSDDLSLPWLAGAVAALVRRRRAAPPRRERDRGLRAASASGSGSRCTSRASTRRSPASRSACSPRPGSSAAASWNPRAPAARRHRLRGRPAVRARQRGRHFGGGSARRRRDSRVAWAVAAGLVLGKLLGIAGATFLGLRLGVGTLPAGVGRGQVWGLAAICGIGFTVSLFIAQLAYDDPGHDRPRKGRDPRQLDPQRTNRRTHPHSARAAHAQRRVRVGRRRSTFVVAPEREEMVLERVEVGEVVGADDLALDDPEVDLGLVEP